MEDEEIIEIVEEVEVPVENPDEKEKVTPINNQKDVGVQEK